MEEWGIGRVAKHYGVTTRTLRYYDEIGLLPCEKASAYRTYSEDDMRRLKQILVLRRLGMPIKRIAEWVADPSIAASLLRETMRETEHDLYVSMALRQAQLSLLRILEKAGASTPCLLDEAAQSLFPSLSEPIKTKEERKMDELKLEMTHTPRAVFLPPMTVASARAFACEPEHPAFAKLNAFIQQSGLLQIKPDLRIFGFNNPSEPNEKGEYGYEYWVTIPADMEVPEPLCKRTFEGGLYVAHCIRMGDFHEWKPFFDWASSNEQYQPVARGPEGMMGGLEEHLNPYEVLRNNSGVPSFPQLDLLIPVKER